MAFRMIQIKDSPLPMGKVWFLDSLGIYIPSITPLTQLSPVFPPSFFSQKSDTFMEQIKGLDTRKLRHRGLLMQQRTARVTPFPPKKKTKEHWNTKQKNMSTILMFLGVDFSIFLLDVELERIHFVLVWMQYSDFLVDCEILLEDLQFSSVNFHATQKITQSMTIRSSAAASCPGHFYPADDVAHVSATMKPKTCHSSFILLPKGKILIIMNLYFYWLV